MIVQQKWIKILDARQTLPELDLHLIVDNYATTSRNGYHITQLGFNTAAAV